MAFSFYKLQEADLKRVLLTLPKALREIIQTESLILAGGYIRSVIAGEEIKDVDLFGDSDEKLSRVATGILTMFPDATLLDTQNAITIYGGSRQKHTIQLIKRWKYSIASAVVCSFDFSICAAAIQWNDMLKQWYSYAHSRFYADLAAKRLFYLRPSRDEDAGGSMLRAVKYTRRGYHISPESLAAVVQRMMRGINSADWTLGTNYDQEKLILDKLREVDPSVRMDGLVDFDEHEREAAGAV